MFKNIIVAQFIMLLSINSAFATNSYFEARNEAMGGTGVASSHYGVGPLANPALLTKYQATDHGSILIPTFGIGISLSQSFNDLYDNFSNLSDHSSDNSGSSTNDSETFKNSAKDIRQLLEKLKNTSVNLQSGTSTVIAIPNDTLSFAFLFNGYYIASATTNINNDDLELLQKIENGEMDNVDPDDVDLQSNLSGKGAAIAELGFSFAKKLETKGHVWSIGITPKLQQIYVVSTNVHLKSALDTTFGYSGGGNLGLNADLGAYTDLYDNWTLGLSIINIIPRSIDVPNMDSDSLKIRPQATAGVAWNYKLVNLAFDLDLSPGSGFQSDEKTQFASLGGEIDIFKWAQLRAGYKQNLRSNTGSAFTAGLGLSPFDVMHLDIAGILGLDNDYGAVAQMKITF